MKKIKTKKPSRKELIKKELLTIQKYDWIHHWLVYHYGKANKCENPGCNYPNPKKFNWALIKGKDYEQNRDNFWMLCPSCHIKYDASPMKSEKLRLLRLGTKYSEATKRKMTLSHIGHTTSLKTKILIASKQCKVRMEDRRKIFKLCKKGILTKTEIGNLFNTSRQVVRNIYLKKELYA